MLLNERSVWLLLGVEDTADVQQETTKGQKNEENNEDNRFVERRSFVKRSVFYTKKEPAVFSWVSDGIRTCSGFASLHYVIAQKSRATLSSNQK